MKALWISFSGSQFYFHNAISKYIYLLVNICNSINHKFNFGQHPESVRPNVNSGMRKQTKFFHIFATRVKNLCNNIHFCDKFQYRQDRRARMDRNMFSLLLSMGNRLCKMYMYKTPPKKENFKHENESTHTTKYLSDSE